MIEKKKILSQIKQLVNKIEPKAKIILYGSFVRGDNRDDSDLDLLILLDKDKITLKDEKRIKYPLYDLEFDTGQVISPLIFTKNEWESKHRITPFYENIQQEGIEI